MKSIDKFINKIFEAAASNLKPGEKKPVKAHEINYELSDEAKLALLAIPKTEAEKARIKKLKQKHQEEYDKLDKLMMAVRKKQRELDKKEEMLNKVVTEPQLKYFSMIEKECASFLNDVKATKRFLYRGMSGSEPVLIGYPHEQRQVKDTKSKNQELFDERLKMCGFKALRSNSIFTTGSRSQAKSYSDSVYLIFPKDGYDFSWSPMHEDWIPTYSEIVGEEDDDVFYNVSRITYLFDYVSDVINDLEYELKRNDFNYSATRSPYPKKTEEELNELKEKMPEDPLFKTIKDNVKKVFADLRKVNIINELDKDQFKRFIDVSKAFLELEKKYTYKFTMVDYRDDNNFRKNLQTIIDRQKEYGKVIPLTKEEAQKFIDRNKLKHDDMVAALNSTNEIYLHGEYIALRARNFENAATKYFLKGKGKVDPYWDQDELAPITPRAKKAPNEDVKKKTYPGMGSTPEHDADVAAVKKKIADKKKAAAKKTTAKKKTSSN